MLWSADDYHMISKEIFRKVRQLEIRTKGLVNNLFGGEYHSAFKGRGMVFSEVREYQYGDDIRQIDWNVTARAGETFIKIFEEEREQTLMLLVDISPSGIFGSKQRKSDLITEMCAVLAFSAIKNGDKVGMILFSDKVEKVVLPKKGRLHVLRLIRELYTTQAIGRGTDLNVPLNFINRLLKRRAIVILASDFVAPDFEKSIKITNKKHDLIAVSVSDPLEDELPNIGIVNLRDAETGETRMIDTSSRKVRTSYKAHRLMRLAKRREQFRKQQIDAVDVSTSNSYVQPLMAFFKRRGARY
jgi:uncharacterized protein (DUF58 family)